MHDLYNQRLTNNQQFKEVKNQQLMTKLSVNMAPAEERRKANLQSKIKKVQTDLEKVKLAKQNKSVNKENVMSNEMVMAAEAGSQ